MSVKKPKSYFTGKITSLPTTTGQKSTRIKRTLAECLTSPEMIKRMRGREDTGTSRDKKIKPKPKDVPQKKSSTVSKSVRAMKRTESDVVVSSKEQLAKKRMHKPQKCQSGKKKCGSGMSHLHIRKPVWLVGNQDKVTTVEQPNNLLSQAPRTLRRQQHKMLHMTPHLHQKPLLLQKVIYALLIAKKTYFLFTKAYCKKLYVCTDSCFVTVQLFTFLIQSFCTGCAYN